MPRRARVRSATGVYHIILRGINKQIVFEESKDYRTFLRVLEHYKDECNFKIFAYCLMNNHIHLLLKENGETVGDVMKKIEVTFVKWYNEKYQRGGNLFQERYKSEPVETEEYLLTVFRYILQNPLHAGMEKKVGASYRWSSFWDYENGVSNVTDLEEMLAFFDTPEELLDFVKRETRDICMEEYSPRTLSDEDSIQVIRQMTGCASPSDFQRLDLEKRNFVLKRLLEVGFSTRQLNRLTGVSRYQLCKLTSR